MTDLADVAARLRALGRDPAEAERVAAGLLRNHELRHATRRVRGCPYCAKIPPDRGLRWT